MTLIRDEINQAMQSFQVWNLKSTKEKILDLIAMFIFLIMFGGMMILIFLHYLADPSGSG